ncbi:hypothetical protein HYDPIDRAFT_25836 [Hydnomerulius pinastri MD-312]|nr:hypothetical protein HYDPIDRAFT_25836 [Hydnomerulius pinastri MD-312]
MVNAEDIPRDPNTGAELLATFVAVALWGMTCSQTLFYFIHFPQDNFRLKALVTWLWIVDTVHQVLLVEGSYSSLVTNFCNYDEALLVKPEYLWQVLLTTIVAIPSQVFFTHRIGRFSGKRWVFFVFLAPGAALELAGALTFIAFGTMIPTAEELVSIGPSSIFTAVQATAAAIDITISAGLVYLLWKSRQDAQMRTVIQKLLILSINTGMWTALFAIVAVIAMLVFKNTFIYAAVYFPLCPLYCNTVLANLNAREVIKQFRPADSMSFLRGTASTDPNVPQQKSVPVLPVTLQAPPHRKVYSSWGEVSGPSMQVMSGASDIERQA